MKKSSSAGSSRAGSGGVGRSIGSPTSPSKPSSASTDMRSASSSASSQRSKPSSADSGRLTRPSDKLNPKTCDPFNDKRLNSSTFAAVYSNGGIPCRLVHGSVKHRLSWNTPIELVTFDPVLVTLAEGLKENVHPYSFVARQGFVELLGVDNSGSKVVPLLSKLITPIRTALSHSDDKVFEAGTEAVKALSTSALQHLNQYIKQFLVPLSRRLNDSKHRDLISSTLQQLERNGGPEATTIIKSKIPTFTSLIR